MTAEVKVREATTSTVAGNADALIDLSHRAVHLTNARGLFG